MRISSRPFLDWFSFNFLNKFIYPPVASHNGDHAPAALQNLVRHTGDHEQSTKCNDALRSLPSLTVQAARVLYVEPSAALCLADVNQGTLSLDKQEAKQRKLLPLPLRCPLYPMSSLSGWMIGGHGIVMASEPLGSNGRA